VEVAAETPSAARPVELSIAGWFILAAALVELCLGRFASLLGVYLGVGASGPLALLASAGEVAMYAAGIASLCVLLGVLPSILGDRSYPGTWWRGLLILVSPVYLLVTALAAFAPRLSPWLILAAYLTAVLIAVVLSFAAAALRGSGGVRRVVLALGTANLLQAFAWAALDFFGIDHQSVLGVVAVRSFLIAEVLWVVAPVVAFFGLFVDSPRKIGLFLRRPHVLGLLTGLAAAAFGAALIARTWGQGAYLTQIAYLTLGVTLSVPGAPWIYVASAFFAALTVGCLALPTRRYPVDEASQRLGLGLALIWIAGLQPYRVFQFALMLLGFALLARGAAGRARGEGRTPTGKGQPDGTAPRP
jgi:hypothetical protein